MERADVIVAGAGPAGAVAARTLARAGRHVLLLDKAAFPRNKPCGGGISTRALRRFPWLAAAIGRIDVHTTSQLHLESPDGNILKFRGAEPAVILIRRIAFDAALVDAAAAAGARVVEGAEIAQVDESRDGVTMRARDGRSFTAPLAIAADGVHSVVAKRLGVRKQWPEGSIAIDMMEESPNETLRSTDPDVLWVAYAYRGMEGYAYVFPKRDHVNAGIGCLLSAFDRAKDGHPYAMQSRFVGELVASGVLSGTSDRACFTPFLIPVGGPMRRPHTARVLFCGDAGGFVNAFTAEGIYYAMLSGELAARAAIDSPRAPGAAYRALLDRECTRELRDAVLVQRFLLSDPSRVNRVVAAGNRADWVGAVIVDYASGRMSYGEARRKMLAASPRTLMKLIRIAVARRLRLAV